MQDATSQVSDAAAASGGDANDEGDDECGDARKRPDALAKTAADALRGDEQLPRDASTASQASETLLFPGLGIDVEEVEEEEVDLTPQQSVGSCEEDSHFSLDVNLVRQDEASFLHHLHEPIIIELEEPICAPERMEVLPLESRAQSKVLRFFALIMRKPSSELLPMSHPARAPRPVAPAQQMQPVVSESTLGASVVPPAPSPAMLAAPFSSAQSCQKLTKLSEREASESDALRTSQMSTLRLSAGSAFRRQSPGTFESTKSQWERSSSLEQRADRTDRPSGHSKPKTLRFGGLLLPQASHPHHADDPTAHEHGSLSSLHNDSNAPQSAPARQRRMLYQVVIRSLEELEHTILLGRGIQGSVYEARHKPTGFRLAVKVEQADQGVYRKGIRREFRVQCALSNRHVVKFYGSFYNRELRSVHTLLQLMEGGSLYHAAMAMKGISEPVLSQLTAHCLEGLKFMHGLGIMHRDIKTQNILISLKEGVAKLTDFGHAKADTMGKTFAGTIEYMSPERLNNEMYTYAADIWSLGLCVVECFMGRHPFPSRPEYWEYIESRKPGDVLFSRFEQNASEELCHFVNQCTRLVPSERPKAEFLLFHPFIRKHKNNTAALEAWIAALAELIASKSAPAPSSSA